ncbi:MAG: GGDEF domain-containing protein [Gemmatimonadetes bacterium]|nr:GGDEF domain-containing protein [Gemmatimonadota bacterium]
MASDKTVLYFGPRRKRPSALVTRFARENGLEVVTVSGADEVRAMLNRSCPGCVILDGDPTGMAELARGLKQDAFTGIVPLIVVLPKSDAGAAADMLAAGADEVVSDGLPEREYSLRLDQALRRADRDVSVHPTTRLPGTHHIARDMQARLEAGQHFAVCYADLDHFKEFNDRYGYANGDGVIRLLSRILRDMARGLAPGGFVGRIGGDDFIMNLPLEYLERTCDEIVRLFDELIPYQYTEEDRRAGYFRAKDRRGNIYSTPLHSTPDTFDRSDHESVPGLRAHRPDQRTLSRNEDVLEISPRLQVRGRPPAPVAGVAHGVRYRSGHLGGGSERPSARSQNLNRSDPWSSLSRARPAPRGSRSIRPRCPPVASRFAAARAAASSAWRSRASLRR